MMFLVKTMPRTVEALHTHTHTSDLVRNNQIYIREKGNIILPCGFYDTG